MAKCNEEMKTTAVYVARCGLCMCLCIPCLCIVPCLLCSIADRARKFERRLQLL